MDVAAGSDAPFGGEDPWQVMRAAVRRPGLFGADEAVSPARALALFLGEPAAPGTPRLVAPGRPADLALLRAGPREVLHGLASDLVAATFIGGEARLHARLAAARRGRTGRTGDRATLPRMAPYPPAALAELAGQLELQRPAERDGPPTRSSCWSSTAGGTRRPG